MTNPSKLNSEWNTLLKQQIQSLNCDDDLQVQVIRPPPHPPTKEKDSLTFFLARARDRSTHNVIDLEGGRPKTGVPSLLAPVRPAPPKTATAITAHRRERDSASVVEVIDVEQASSKRNIEKYKRAIFGETPKPPRAREQLPVRTSSAMREQMRIIEDSNKPAWMIHRDERRAINREKYPNSYTHSYNRSFSGVGNEDDETWKDYRRRREERHQTTRERKALDSSQAQQRKEEELKRKKEEQLDEYANLVSEMIGIEPKKMVKPNTESSFEYSKEEARLINSQILEQLKEEENEQGASLPSPYSSQPLQHRFGLADIVKNESSAPQFIHSILRHKYGEEVKKSENKRIPNSFEDWSTYKNAFHYLITNECIADLRHRLKGIEKSVPEPIKTSISSIRTNTDGQVQLTLQQRESEKGEFQLKNFSLSKYRLGLLCSSKEYRREYYGVPGRNHKEFAFIVLLLTPETKEDLGSEVKAISTVSETELELLLKRRKSREVNFFDLEKLSTHIRQYLAVTSTPYSELSPTILRPQDLEKELGVFTHHRQVLDDILNYLQEIFNPTQWQSIREMVYRERGFVLLQGPPGTGKTSTLMGLLSAQYEYLKRRGDNRKIMICAPSNAAVNHIVRRIIREGLFNGEGEIIEPKILRVGIVDTEDAEIRSVSLDDRCEKQLIESSEAAKKLSKMTSVEIKEKIILLQKEVRRLPRTASEQISQKQHQLLLLESLLFQFRREKIVNSRKNYAEIEKGIIGEAEILLTTLSSSGNDRLVNRIRGEIACLIVDEAAQATEPNLLIALQTGVPKVLLIGDPYQLPATCISPDSNITLFNRSLFERFLDAGIQPYFLNIQYRMAPLIREFPSSRFYHDRLLDSDTITSRESPDFLENFQGRNVVFIDVKRGEEQRRGDSHWNKLEAEVVSLLIRCLIDRSVSLGVITPYQAQRKAILRDCMARLRENAEDQLFLQKQVMINTVDSFQGQEKDIIIVSTVRANPHRQVGFLTDERRINVTLTRAKHLMIVVGHGDTLGSNEVWDQFLSWAETHGVYYEFDKQKKTDDIIGEIFKDFSQNRVQRRHYKQLSTDVRKKERNQIQSRDFRLPEPRHSAFPAAPLAEAEAMVDEGEEGEERHALDVKQSERIVHGKLGREAEEVRIEEMQRRLREFEESNLAKLKADPFYNYLFE